MIAPEVARLAVEQADLFLLGAAGARLVGDIVLQVAVNDQIAVVAIVADDIHVFLIARSRGGCGGRNALAGGVGVLELRGGVAKGEAVLLVGRQVELGAALPARALRHAGRAARCQAASSTASGGGNQISITRPKKATSTASKGGSGMKIDVPFKAI